MRLSRIENRILEIKKKIIENEKELKKGGGLTLSQFELRLATQNKPLLEEKDELETERQFILDRRNGLFWRIVWNAIVPIIVAFITAYLVSYFLN